MNPDQSQDDVRAALRELDQAIYNHERWVEAVNCTLVCRLPPDERDMDDQAYRKCRFGQWYYAPRSEALRDHPGFAAIEGEHTRMHEIGANLLRRNIQNQPMELRDYENFLSAVKRMQLEVMTLKRELEERLLNTDQLTGARNRLQMLTTLREQLQLVRRNVQYCSIAMMDLDHFKAINDTHGHSIGDQVLRVFSAHILASIRPYDKLFRYGGEEFLICLPNTTLPLAFSVIERLREGLAALPIEDSLQHRFQVTASFGIAALDPTVSVEKTIERADTALYAAKSQGRNRTVTETPIDSIVS